MNKRHEIAKRADIGWNGIHRDARNSDATPYEIGPYLSPSWTALEGAAILFGPSIGPQKRRYVTTGQGGGNRHLHAFEADGSRCFEDHPDWLKPGPRICTDVPLFDDAGRMYVSGENHVWCFKPSGDLLWISDMTTRGAHGGLVSTIITKSGYVGGVTLYGQIILLDPETGALAKPIFQTPVGPVFEPVSPMPGLWEKGFMDRDIAQRIEPAFFGRGFPVTSSPAVNPTNGLIYYVAVSRHAGFSTLYAVQENSAELELVFQTDLEGICTASPSVSPDNARVYTVNGAGLIHAFDAETGSLVWTRSGGNMAASPTVGLDDVVYSAGVDAEDGRSYLLAIQGKTGTLLLRRNYDHIARAALPSREVNNLFPNELGTAVANSVPTVAPNVVFLLVNLGYPFKEPTSARMMHQPHIPCLLSIDPMTGDVISHTNVRDTSEAVIVAGDDGYLHVCHASLLSSVFYYGINPHLPEHLRSGLKPIGGFSTFKTSFA
jgi:outer membrane protein assembly factor BamB